jgi:hypothetical protein
MEQSGHQLTASRPPAKDGKPVSAYRAETEILWLNRATTLWEAADRVSWLHVAASAHGSFFAVAKPASTSLVEPIYRRVNYGSL